MLIRAGLFLEAKLKFTCSTRVLKLTGHRESSCLGGSFCCIRTPVLRIVFTSHPLSTCISTLKSLPLHPGSFDASSCASINWSPKQFSHLNPFPTTFPKPAPPYTIPSNTLFQTPYQQYFLALLQEPDSSIHSCSSYH